MKTQTGPRPSKAKRDPYLSLAAGVIALATKEARKGDKSAAAWLLSDEAALFLDCLGMDKRRIHVIAGNWYQAKRPPVKVTWKIGLRPEGEIC